MARVRRRPEVPTLKLTDFSDREFLALVRDLGDTEGWVSAESIAEAIWPNRTEHLPVKGKDNETRPYNPGSSSVSSRLGWMRRFGVVLRNEVDGTWQLNDRGRAFVERRLTQRTEELIMGLDDAAMMNLGYTLSDRYLAADDVAATLFRRSMRYAQERRRWR